MEKTNRAKSGRRSYRLTDGIRRGANTDPSSGLLHTENMYVDYEGGGDALESIPGFRRLCSLGGRVYTVSSFCHSDGIEYIYVHSGRALYRFKKEEKDEIGNPSPIAFLADRQSFCLSEAIGLFITDGERLIAIDSEGELRILSEDISLASSRSLAIFDGRLFLSANPSLPGRLFYSQKKVGDFSEPFAFESLVTDSVGRVVSLFTLSDRLVLFGDKGIAFLRSDDREKYSVEQQLVGIRTSGRAIAYDGRLLFLSDGRLMCLDRAENVLRLTDLSEEVSPALSVGEWSLCGVWRGYILLCREDTILLGDTRQLFHCQRGWFPLSGIGCYSGDRRVYRYSSIERKGYDLYHLPDTICYGEAMSLINEDGESVYYEQNGDKKYLIYPTAEFQGGDFSAPASVLTDGYLLWFGTARGEICVFNNDKRGEPPAYMNGDDAEEYRRTGGDRIHPEYYSFAGHAARYAMTTRYDDCGYPDLCKVTESRSFIIKLKSFPKSSLSVGVSTDGKRIFDQKIHHGEIGFCEIDFDNIATMNGADISVILPERAAGWREKQISLSSEEFSAPFGVISLCYGYKTLGKIKKKQL